MVTTQQTAGTYVIQVRDFLPNAVGGVLWFGNDDPNPLASFAAQVKDYFK